MIYPAVILAGGQASRMGGGDKCLLPLGGRSMLSHVIDRIGAQAGPLALNANGPAGRFDSYGLRVLPDTIAGYPGPLAGVLAGLDWAASLGAEAVVSVAGDTPFFPTDLTARLRAEARAQAHPLVLAATPREAGVETRSMTGKLIRHPTFGLWPVALRDDLRAALEGGLKKVVLWTEPHGGRMAVFDDTRAFFNVNTPEDLAEAEAML